MGKLISLGNWAKKNGIDPATARQRAGRGAFDTAQKIGRNWVIDEDEKLIDHRKKEDKKMDKLNFIKLDASGDLPEGIEKAFVVFEEDDKPKPKMYDLCKGIFATVEECVEYIQYLQQYSDEKFYIADYNEYINGDYNPIEY